MLELSEIIIRIRETCDIFENRVGGTATFGAVTTIGRAKDMAFPSCFVVPVREDNITGQDQYIGDDTERRRETFATVVCVDNSVARGEGKAGLMKLDAINQLRIIQNQLEDAWNDWVPRQKFDVIQFVSGEHLAMDNVVLFHEFRWLTDYTTSPAATDELTEELNRQVRWITEGELSEDELPDVEEIVVGYEPERWIEDPVTVEDFFLNWPPLPLDENGDPIPLEEPTEEQLEAARDAADRIIDVVEESLPPIQ